jgi:transposase
MDVPELAEIETDNTLKIGRKSAGRPRVELITRGERRRRWSIEQKQGIVAESLRSDTTPTKVARKYAISSGLLYSWRQQVLGGHVSVVTGPAPSFARVELAPALQAPDGSEPVSPAVPAPPSGPDGGIEIVLRSGVLVRVDAAVDGRALRRVLSALDD